ncbi:hypothetical protein CPB83DRAFT_842077 [Crepidotus variabilis]|uniref:Uncharacterized protein n=1 Tax=Crepidotus variabilis TaxID=179855 RepID=A0A9P6JWG6_9AGAR|nr:hypothetical protein CPB83DRAFT_842077 [Crepidotus variabilis]
MTRGGKITTRVWSWMIPLIQMTMVAEVIYQAASLAKATISTFQSLGSLLQAISGMLISMSYSQQYRMATTSLKVRSMPCIQRCIC